MTLLQPAYRITLGKQTIDTTDEPRASTVTELHLELGMEAPADQLRLLLGQVGGLDPAVGDDAMVELGYADDGRLTRVFTGTVTEITPGLITRPVTALGLAVRLLHTFVDHTFEEKHAGEMVRELAEGAGLTVAETQPGIRFPAYVIDGRCSVHDHLRELAELCGFDLYCNAAGELVFRPFTRGERTHRFDYGEQILELVLDHTPPAAATVEGWGEGPGSGASESWAWLTKDFSGAKGSAGGGEPRLLLERPVLRSAAAAQTAAEARWNAIQRNTLRGWLLCSGRPDVMPGDAIRLSGLPERAHDGTYQVRTVSHRLTKTAGFTTSIGFRRIDRGT